MTMKNRQDEGFSLIEAVAALLVISLALASVFQLARMTARAQTRAAAVAATAAEDSRAVRLVESHVRKMEPLMQATLQASPERLKCARSDGPCEISAPVGYHFQYVVDGAPVARWPDRAHSKTEESDPEGRVTALVLLDKTGRTAGVIELAVDHTADCRFDLISRTCRSADEAIDPPQGGEDGA
jgi:type II secretory pathway pseudopilin PulG